MRWIYSKNVSQRYTKEQPSFELSCKCYDSKSKKKMTKAQAQQIQTILILREEEICRKMIIIIRETAKYMDLCSVCKEQVLSVGHVNSFIFSVCFCFLYIVYGFCVWLNLVSGSSVSIEALPFASKENNFCLKSCNTCKRFQCKCEWWT